MIADLGFAALLLAFCAALFAAAAAWYGARRDDGRWVEAARNSMTIILPLLMLASGLLIYLLWTNDFSVAYVSRVTSIGTPKYLKVTALWGGQAGSLLFWNLLLAVFTAAATRRNWDNERELMPYVILVASLTQIFFLFISSFIENPFARNAFVPADGQGLNPLLRHPGMIIHPPMLYLGFVGFTIPYAYAIAALMAGRSDDNWIRVTRRWTLVAWLFLSLGLILGGRWAYDVLGWGGYWGWDAVENSSLLPWLAGTAFLHSVIIQEKRGMFKVWNMVLVITTYLLVILGTFAVRSGLVSSVHTFAQSSIGWYFFAFIALMLIFSLYWLTKRSEGLGSRNRLESLLSREAAFLLNNFLIMAILAATALGIYFPVFSELFGDRITVGPPYYEMVTGPLFLALVLLMGVAPLTMYHRTQLRRLGEPLRRPALVALLLIVVIVALGVRNVLALIGIYVVFLSLELTLLEYWKAARARMRRGDSFVAALAGLFRRNRRRYGGYLIHLGVLVMAFGIIGIEFFQQETQLRLAPGESLQLGRYQATFTGVERYSGADDLLITEAALDVFSDGRYVTTLRPRIDLYQRSGQPMTIPDLRSTPLDDFYLLLVNWEGVTQDGATFKVYLNPLVNWVWAGGLIFVLGTAVAAWPGREDVFVPATRAAATVAAD